MWELLGTPAATAIISASTFVVGGVAGFLSHSLVSTPAERQQQRQRLYENGRHHKEMRAKLYGEFTTAIRNYISKKNSGATLSLDDFQRVSTAGDLYFNELQMSADAILAKSIDKHSRNTLVTAIVEALQKNIPLYYETLQKIAERIGAEYNGKFKRQNYESMFQVSEKYASDAVMPPVSDAISGHSRISTD